MFQKYFPKPNTKESKADSTLASVKFLIKEDNNKLTVDIGIEDFSEESIIALSELINTIFTDQARLETLNIIQQSFLERSEEAAFLKLITLVASSIKTKGQSNGPYIKPSQLLP
jgi:hypothetical protein